MKEGTEKEDLDPFNDGLGKPADLPLPDPSNARFSYDIL